MEERLIRQRVATYTVLVLIAHNLTTKVFSCFQSTKLHSLIVYLWFNTGLSTILLALLFFITLH
mgnify:CR=1 FL=1